jgi:hypothetical protein
VDRPGGRHSPAGRHFGYWHGPCAGGIHRRGGGHVRLGPARLHSARTPVRPTPGPLSQVRLVVRGGQREFQRSRVVAAAPPDAVIPAIVT